jgi:hypothetical protein
VKNLLSPLIIILLMCTGCIPVFTPVEIISTEPPVAYIDSISSSRIFEGENVKLNGHGVDPEDTIVAYSWRSSLDGVLSTEPSFETSSLSTGRNTIYFKVQDSSGQWSQEKYQYITVIPEGSMKPIINKFVSNLTSINKGESVVLTWDVSGASSVNIEPAIGNVSFSGTRSITPTETTRYTLSASNESGVSTTSIEIKTVVASLPIVENNVVQAESGSVSYYKKINSVPMAGFDLESSYCYEAFLSFDISMIPKGSLIKSVSLDLTNMSTIGDPFTWLGSMAVFPHQYGTLDYADYVYKENIPGGYPRGAIITSYSRPLEPYTSEVIKETIQQLVDNGESRFQIRIQFERTVVEYRDNINVEFVPELTRIKITYE